MFFKKMNKAMNYISKYCPSITMGKNYHFFTERGRIGKAEEKTSRRCRSYRDEAAQCRNTNRQRKSQTCTIRNIYCKSERIYSVTVKF